MFVVVGESLVYGPFPTEEEALHWTRVQHFQAKVREVKQPEWPALLTGKVTVKNELIREYPYVMVNLSDPRTENPYDRAHATIFLADDGPRYALFAGRLDARGKTELTVHDLKEEIDVMAAQIKLADLKKVKKVAYACQLLRIIARQPTFMVFDVANLIGHDVKEVGFTLASKLWKSKEIDFKRITAVNLYALGKLKDWKPMLQKAYELQAKEFVPMANMKAKEEKKK